MTCRCQPPETPAHLRDLIDDLASAIRHGRALDAAHAANRALATTATRHLAAAIPRGHVATVASALTTAGVPVDESLLRKWARAGELIDPPTWWEIIDHRPPDELQTILETTLGMEVDVADAPCVLVPVTSAQVETLRAALPGAVIGPVAETVG